MLFIIEAKQVGIEIQQNWLQILDTINKNGEWPESIEDCQPVSESSNNLLVVNKEQTVNASTENNNDTNDYDVSES